MVHFYLYPASTWISIQQAWYGRKCHPCPAYSEMDSPQQKWMRPRFVWPWGIQEDPGYVADQGQDGRGQSRPVLEASRGHPEDVWASWGQQNIQGTEGRGDTITFLGLDLFQPIFNKISLYFLIFTKFCEASGYPNDYFRVPALGRSQDFLPLPLPWGMTWVCCRQGECLQNRYNPINMTLFVL